MITYGYGHASAARASLSSDKKRLLFRLSVSTPERPLNLEFEMDVGMALQVARVIQELGQRSSVKKPSGGRPPRLRIVKNDDV